MKKICLLLVLTLLLSGCGQEPLPTETTVTEESTAPVETTETAGEIPATEAVTGDHSYRGEDWESGYVAGAFSAPTWIRMCITRCALPVISTFSC